MTKPVPNLITPRTILRLATPEDVDAIIDFYRTNAIHLEKFAIPKPQSFYEKEFWRDRIAGSHQDFKQDKSCNLFIFDSENPSHIHGFTNFFAFIRGAFHACILGYGLAEDSEGHGLMTESLTAAIEYVFSSLNLHRIQANHDPTNTRSANVLRRLNFVPEGYARDYLLVNGQWHDHVLTSLTSNRWKSP